MIGSPGVGLLAQASSPYLIDRLLENYLSILDLGFDRLGGDVSSLFQLLGVIHLAIAGLFWALSEDQVVVQLARKALYIGFFAWLIENWGELTELVGVGFIELGLRAGGSAVSNGPELTPGAVAFRGVALIAPIVQRISDLSGLDVLDNLIEVFQLLLSLFAILVAFFALAMQMFFAKLVFKLGALACFVLVPFALLNRTAFIAERPFGWVVASGIRLMLLTMVLGLAESILKEAPLTAEALTIEAAFNFALGSLVLLGMSLLVSRIAENIASGTARLGNMDVAFTLAGLGRAGGTVISTARDLGTGTIAAAARLRHRASAAWNKSAASSNNSSDQERQ